MTFRITELGGTAELGNALWIAANTKKCPKCKTATEKNEGCNHMTCKRCRYEYCWICMQDWSLHGTKTGGYFRCNRFDADGADGGEDDKGAGGGRRRGRAEDGEEATENRGKGSQAGE